MNIIKDVEQGSSEWLKLRLGKITASKMKDLLTNGRSGKPSKTAETYMYELIAERLTGESKPFFENDAMRWGTDKEPEARAMYELHNNVTVEEVAFIELDENIGMSPDGLVGDKGLLEIKCPATVTQLKRALTDDYSSDYTAQIQMQLWVSGREWCDFVSYDPRLAGSASYLQIRRMRDDEFIKGMIEKTELFIIEMNSIIKQLT